MSLNITSSRFDHVVTTDRIPFFLKAEQYPTVYLCHLILPTGRHLVWFHTLATSNSQWHASAGFTVILLPPWYVQQCELDLLLPFLRSPFSAPAELLPPSASGFYPAYILYILQSLSMWLSLLAQLHEVIICIKWLPDKMSLLKTFCFVDIFRCRQ